MPTPSILCGPGSPPASTGDSAGSTATISTSGLCRFNMVATPRTVAAVPTQCTNAASRPPVWLQISSPSGW